MIMKIKILVMFLIFSCNVNTEMENSNSDIELPALRINQSFSKGYRVLKTTISDPFVFDAKFPATDLSIGYVLRYYFYTAIDLSSTNNVLLSMNNNSFSMPETSDPIELVRAVIYEIRDMAYGSKEYQDFNNQIDVFERAKVTDLILEEEYFEAAKQILYLEKNELILEEFQNWDDFYYWSGFIYFNLGNYNEASSNISKISNKDKSPETLFLEALIYKEMGDIESAHLILKYIIKEFSDNEYSGYARDILDDK